MNFIIFLFKRFWKHINCEHIFERADVLEVAFKTDDRRLNGYKKVTYICKKCGKYSVRKYNW